MRLDKYLSNLGYGSRKNVVKMIKNGLIQINGKLTLSPNKKINYGDNLKIQEEEIEVKEFIYIALNKPANYISSNKSEKNYPSYRELMQDCPYVNLLYPVGRLDVDAEGLLILTNDGDFAHKLIHPKKDIFKKYYVKLENPISETDIKKLENGVKINIGIEYKTKPAKLEKINDNEVYISISEGKFHQIKKMFEVVGNKVIYLKRLSVGKYELSDLELGKWKYLEKLY